MLPECLPELPALANVVIVVAPCRCAASATRCTSVLNQTPVGSKRKKKRKSTHQWPSVSEHHLVHTIRTQDESIQKKRAICLGHIRNVPARANPVCAVHRPCLRKDRKRAGMSRSGTSRATQHGSSSSAASGPPPCWVAKKYRLSVTQVRLVLVERRSSHCLPEAHHVDPNVSTANQVSALLHTRFSRCLGTRLRAGIWEDCLPFQKMIDQAKFCWSSSIALGLGEGAKILSENHHVLDRRV